MTDRMITLDPVTPETADDYAASLLERGKAMFGFIPALFANMANSPGLLETYMDGYNRFREHTVLTPAEQEVVLLTVSRVNACHYCVPAHSFMADNVSNVPREVTQAIRDGADIPDPKLAALSGLVRALMSSRGKLTRADRDAFLAAGYTERHMVDVLLGIAIKTISNFTNALFQTQLDDMIAPYA